MNRSGNGWNGTGLNNSLILDGMARIKFLMIPKEVPFSRTVPVTAGDIAGMVTGQKKD